MYRGGVYLPILGSYEVFIVGGQRIDQKSNKGW